MDAPRLISEVRLWTLYGKELLKRVFGLPDGTTSDFYVFRGTTNPVIIFPLASDNKVIVVRQFRYGANDFVLELPGGVLRTEETLEKL